MSDSAAAEPAPQSLSPHEPIPSIFSDDRVLALLMIAPAVLYILLLVGIPFFMALYYSVADVTVGGGVGQFVGLQNFSELLADPAFLTALANSFVFTVASLVLTLVLGHLLAELLIRDFPLKWLVRFLILLPWTAPIALSATGWLWMFDTVFSPIDWLLRQVGLLGSPEALLGSYPNMYWLGDSTLAMVSVILVNTWRIMPLGTVLLLAGMNSIPQEIHEQARVDGAGYMRRLFDINIPMILPVLLIAILFAFVFIFSDMIVIFILTRGGPSNATQVLSSLAYFVGIEGADLGKGAAIALFLFPALAGVAGITLTMIRRLEVSGQ